MIIEHRYCSTLIVPTPEEAPMSDPRPADTDRRRQTHRRAKRGLIASYIHQLADRHNGGGSRPPARGAHQEGRATGAAGSALPDGGPATGAS